MPSATPYNADLPVALAGRQLVKAQNDAVIDVCRGERDKESLTICIAPRQALKEIKKSCTRRRAPSVMFTTPEELQDSIDSAELSEKIHKLKLLFSGVITEILFTVPSHFRQLKVLRCVPKGYGGHLLIDGASTYHETRLDKWQAHRHKYHELVVGHSRGVRIALNDFTNLPNWSQCRANFTAKEQEELRGHFQAFDTKKTPTNWDNIRGRVSAIMGLAVGSVKFAVGFKAVAGGLYLKYAFGLHAFELGMAGAKVVSVATLAGSAVVLGAGVAAAVYFVPWEILFTWLEGKFSWLWEKICQFWQFFKDCVKKCFSSWSTQDSDGDKFQRPMPFAA